MLKLQNVSKFYYSNGVITSGITRVSLELRRGEFVCITGESGSGKSTLLNVLSGLDSYEEGELYVDGQETSHYTEADFEAYRRRYIGNIFQDYKLVDSFTVFENVELALLLAGEKKAAARRKVKEMLDRVHMTGFARTKCAKLSGGQKQRVAIARALATDPPVLVADEPTGNLDSAAASDVLKLLSEVAADKLVLLVTHSPEQVAPYATRMIKMHDGRVLEDRVLRAPKTEDERRPAAVRGLTVGSKIRLGLRSAVNIPVKFALIFTVFLVIAAAVTGTWATFQKLQDNETARGYNYYFQDVSGNRIVLKKSDASALSEADFAALRALPNVETVMENDLLTDYECELASDDDWLQGFFRPLSDFTGQVTFGRLPNAPYELLYVCSGDSYYFTDGEARSNVLNRPFSFFNYDSGKAGGRQMTVVGLAKSDDAGYSGIFYTGDEVMDFIGRESAVALSNVSVLFAGTRNYVMQGNPNFFITPNAKVPAGSAYVSSNLNDDAPNGDCRGMELRVDIDNPYFTDSLALRVANVYTKTNFQALTGEPYDESQIGRVYINAGQYDALMNKGAFQCSVYVKDEKLLDDTAAALESMGYTVLVMRDALNNDEAEVAQMFTMLRGAVLVLMIAALFFISYFVIRVVLNSRNNDYTTLRTLGAPKEATVQLLTVELAFTATLAYGVFLLFSLLVSGGAIRLSRLREVLAYLRPWHYAGMYVILIGMAWLIARRFCKKLFKNTVMNTYREGA